MRLLRSAQIAPIEDAVRAKVAMVIPVLEATLFGLNADRLARLGGLPQWTLRDLAREYREGHGDAGICFEYAVHEAITAGSDLIYPLASETLARFCGIRGDAASLLFGPEKDGRIPILESVQDALTEDSRVYVGNRGRPPLLRNYIPQIIRAFRRDEDRALLPRSIRGLWKADLFLGSTRSDSWVGTTVKINPVNLEGAQGLRIGIYPKANQQDVPRRDEQLNLIRLPLPYDGQFMEFFYKSFYLVRAFLRSDARVPSEIHLPDAEDRFVCGLLQERQDFPMLQVTDVLREMAQPNLLSQTDRVGEAPVTATLSEESGLTRDEAITSQADAGYMTLTPKASTTE